MDWKKEYDEGRILNGIAGFQGKYKSLSNFYDSDKLLAVRLPYGYPVDQSTIYLFDNVESAYQASKTLDKEAIGRIISAGSPGRAKREGRRIPLRSDWELIKYNVMEDLVRQKYFACKEFRDTLDSIPEDKLIVEMNYWHDTYWGVDMSTLKGENNLGKILMDLKSMKGVLNEKLKQLPVDAKLKVGFKELEIIEGHNDEVFFTHVHGCLDLYPAGMALLDHAERRQNNKNVIFKLSENQDSESSEGSNDTKGDKDER